MIVRKHRRPRFADFGIANEVPKPTSISDDELKKRWAACPTENWDQWCDCVWKGEEEYRLRCKSKPWACCPIGLCPDWANPWEDYGAGCRFLYKPDAGFAYGIGIGTKTVSLTSLVTDPIQRDEIKAKEKKEYVVRTQQEAAYVAELERKRAFTKTATNVAIAAGATGVVLVLLGVAKRRRARS